MEEEYNDQTPDDCVELDRIVKESISKIAEHCDAVSIFVNKKREDGVNGTWGLSDGAGNWYARFGQISRWVALNTAPDEDDV